MPLDPPLQVISPSLVPTLPKFILQVHWCSWSHTSRFIYLALVPAFSALPSTLSSRVTLNLHPGATLYRSFRSLDMAGERLSPGSDL